ncbi:CaiB/BaiF CoA-transferase family protein [Dietzia sp. ANT_WB102]|uniref:CaiB/BaiF CoA transferase family protein n=1 Tax=Dietzia sp. ANT_WB102 TaxID=2597345 RepID=UPI00165E9D64|nr:CoA transferase [Dietzia sp. ANT_WB102]
MDSELIPPLDGVRVLDFSRYVSGPYAGMLLADAGAEVIKVEPEGGEVSRSLPPIMQDGAGNDHSTYFLRLNRGKKSVVLDPRSAEHRPALERLIASADVVLENFRPGAFEAWGLGWEELQRINPRLTYATITGFGHSPSRSRDWPAFNLVAEAMAGVVGRFPEGDQPAKAAGLPFGDSMASLHAVNGIVMSLLRRATTGRGSRVDIAMYDSMLSANEWSIACQSGAGIEVELGATVHPWFAPYGFFEARDGWLCICVATDGAWKQFCAVAGLDQLWSDMRLRTGTGRAEHFHEVIASPMSAWLAATPARTAATLLADAGVPAAPLQRPPDLVDDEQGRTREMLTDHPVGDGGSITLAGNPVRIEPRLAPHAQGFSTPGQHTDEILGELFPEHAISLPSH